MTKKLIFVLMIVTGVLLILAACAPAAAPTEAATTSSSGGSTTIDAKALVESQCTQCHSLARVEAEKTDKAGWTSIVERMMSKGSNITFTDAEKAAVIEYLAATYK